MCATAEGVDTPIFTLFLGSYTVYTVLFDIILLILFTLFLHCTRTRDFLRF